jgi:hypothetical protein
LHFFDSKERRRKGRRDRETESITNEFNELIRLPLLDQIKRDLVKTGDHNQERRMNGRPEKDDQSSYEGQHERPALDSSVIVLFLLQNTGFYFRSPFQSTISSSLEE